MKIVFDQAPVAAKPTINQLAYGECCQIPPRSTEVFMRLQTTHKRVQICKTDRADRGINLVKMLNLVTHEIECMELGTQCVPVEATLLISSTAS